MTYSLGRSRPVADTLLCTCPGRHGDILWTLPAIRALHESTGATIDLLVAGKYAAVCPLLERQPYLRECVAMPEWTVEETAPMTPRLPPGIPAGYDRVIHLGYAGWPDRPLPDQHLWTLQQQIPDLDLVEQIAERYTLDHPWIHVPVKAGRARAVYCGWSDEHFELKVGVTQVVKDALARGRTDWSAAASWHVGVSPASRWQREARTVVGSGRAPESWMEAAGWIAQARVFLGCCSALHVLACGLGIPVVLVEPNEARHHPIFYPYGTDGPQVTLVKGNDGRPSFDARHVGDVLAQQLVEATHAR
jgi:hypothetical protein